MGSWTDEEREKFAERMHTYWGDKLATERGKKLAREWRIEAEEFPFKVAMEALRTVWKNRGESWLPGIKAFLDEVKGIRGWNERYAPVVSLGGGNASEGPIITLPYFYAIVTENPNLLSGDAKAKSRKLEFIRRTREAVLRGATFQDILMGRVGKPEKDDEVPF